MPGKKMLIYRDLFYADDTHARLELDDLVNKQKRIPVRQYLLNSE
jgi:hypothetical protein